MPLPYRDEIHDNYAQTEPWNTPFWHRLLAAKSDDSGRMDYSVLSVGVFTLGLIMVVEVCSMVD